MEILNAVKLLCFAQMNVLPGTVSEGLTQKTVKEVLKHLKPNALGASLLHSKGWTVTMGAEFRDRAFLFSETKPYCVHPYLSFERRTSGKQNFPCPI